MTQDSVGGPRPSRNGAGPTARADGERITGSQAGSSGGRRVGSLGGITSLRCSGCEAIASDPANFRCPICGSPLELPVEAAFIDPAVAPGPGDGWGVWRYRRWLPVRDPVTLGEPTTPVVVLPFAGRDVAFKLEAANPTGSFKDRCCSVIVAWLRERGVRHIAEDSSGNAGASLAAYASRAGLACDIYVPATASPPKLTQIQVYGARVIPVPGPRAAATDAAIAGSVEGIVYASHLWNPFSLVGLRTYAWELWEQLGHTVPDVVVFPVGGGVLILGVFRGMVALREAGLIDRLPRFYGVQARASAPLATAMELGLDEPAQIEQQPSAAEGIMLARPPRGRMVLASVRAAGGTIIAVEEDEIWTALGELGRIGVYVEPTSAVAAAGLERLVRDKTIGAEERVVVALTGSGLKAGPQIRASLFPD